MGPHRFTVVPASLDGSANTLLELAGLLQAGHPELEMTGRMQGPAMPADLVIATRDYAEFAHDQYQDIVALLAALSTKLSVAARQYTRVDDDSARMMMNDYLFNSRYQPEQR